MLYRVLISDALQRRLKAVSPSDLDKIAEISPHVADLVRAAERAEVEPPPVLPKLFDLKA